MIPWLTARPTSIDSIPRESGDDPSGEIEFDVDEMYSPRERG